MRESGQHRTLLWIGILFLIVGAVFMVFGTGSFGFVCVLLGVAQSVIGYVGMKKSIDG